MWCRNDRKLILKPAYRHLGGIYDEQILLQNNIRTNSNIRGINIGEIEIKVLQYADDTTGVLKDDCSLKSLLDVITSFEKNFRFKN